MSNSNAKSAAETPLLEWENGPQPNDTDRPSTLLAKQGRRRQTDRTTPLEPRATYVACSAMVYDQTKPNQT